MSQLVYEERLGTERMLPLIFHMALPAIAAQIVNLLYNLVDRIYIGHIPGIGTDALAGIGVTSSIIILISAFSAIVGSGGAPLAAIALGQNDRARASQILGNGFTLLLLFSLVTSSIVYLFMRPILLMIGASSNTIGYAVDYLSIYLLGTLFVQIAVGLNSFINTQGRPTIAMLSVIIGAVLNILLDPLFIFVFEMGVKGAAWATIISQAFSAAWVLAFLCSDRASLRLNPKQMRLNWKTVSAILALGVSPFHHGQHGKPGRICPEQQPEGLWRHLRQRPGHHAKRHAPGECSPYGIRARFHTHCQLQLRAQGQGPCPRMFQDRIACHVLVQPAPDPFDDPVSRGRRLRLHERRATDRDRRPSHAPFPGRHVDLRFTKSLPKYVRRFGTGKSLCLHRPAPESIPVDPARVDLTQLLGNKRRFRGRGHLRRDRRHLLHDDFRHPISQNTQQIIYHRSTTSLKKQKSSIPNDLTSNYFVFLRNLFKQTIKPLFLIMKTNLYLVAAALTFLASCGQETKKSESTNALPKQEEATVTQTDANSGATGLGVVKLDLPADSARTVTYNFLNTSKPYYVTTIDGDKPRVRPTGVISLLKEKLWFHVGKQKGVYQQALKNPHVEVAATGQNREWIRISGEVVCEDDPEVTQAVFEKNPHLKNMYNEKTGDQLGSFYFKHATVEISRSNGSVESFSF